MFVFKYFRKYGICLLTWFTARVNKRNFIHVSKLPIYFFCFNMDMVYYSSGVQTIFDSDTQYCIKYYRDLWIGNIRFYNFQCSLFLEINSFCDLYVCFSLIRILYKTHNFMKLLLCLCDWVHLFSKKKIHLRMFLVNFTS